MFISDDVLKASKSLASEESFYMYFKNIWKRTARTSYANKIGSQSNASRW